MLCGLESNAKSTPEEVAAMTVEQAGEYLDRLTGKGQGRTRSVT